MPVYLRLCGGVGAWVLASNARIRWRWVSSELNISDGGLRVFMPKVSSDVARQDGFDDAAVDYDCVQQFIEDDYVGGDFGEWCAWRFSGGWGRGSCGASVSAQVPAGHFASLGQPWRDGASVPSDARAAAPKRCKVGSAGSHCPDRSGAPDGAGRAAQRDTGRVRPQEGAADQCWSERSHGELPSMPGRDVDARWPTSQLYGLCSKVFAHIPGYRVVDSRWVVAEFEGALSLDGLVSERSVPLPPDTRYLAWGLRSLIPGPVAELPLAGARSSTRAAGDPPCDSSTTPIIVGGTAARFLTDSANQYPSMQAFDCDSAGAEDNWVGGSSTLLRGTRDTTRGVFAELLLHGDQRMWLVEKLEGAARDSMLTADHSGAAVTLSLRREQDGVDTAVNSEHVDLR